MDGNFGITSIYFLLIVLFIILALMIMVINPNRSLIPPPKERNFSPAIADWAQKQKLRFTPQQVNVVSGIYNNRWFAIAMTNEENALQIRMRVQNPGRTSLQIFGDWLEDYGVTAFVNRFRIYSMPSGTGETLFDTGTKLQASLLLFPGLRARFDLNSDSKDPNYLHYSLLTDLPGADTLEIIMDCLARFCEAFEKQVVHESAEGSNHHS